MVDDRVYSKIQVVDEDDNLLGVETYHDAIEKGCIRRASRIMILNKSGKILLSRRSEFISNPLLLDNSAAGHVDEGETYLEAALRELEEELGITGYPLKEIVTSHRAGSFFNSLYCITVPDDIEMCIDPHEVKEVIWVTSEELDVLVKERQNECTKSLVDVWLNFKEALVQ